MHLRRSHVFVVSYKNVRGITLATSSATSDILIVDDDPIACDVLAKILERSGHKCTVAQSGAEAFQSTQKQPYDLLLLDLCLPDIDGLRLLHALREQGLHAPTIIITAHPSLSTALDALCCEVSDYLPKPFHNEELVETIHQVLEDTDPLGNEYLWRSLETTHAFHHVMSRNPRTRQVYLEAAKVARSHAPVMICGETGTGKEFLARTVHYLSTGAAGPLVVLNCGAFPQELLESELFGHEKGAFTSAGTAQPGLCELADGGTLFLDEIGDMGLPMQVKLLRFLQDGTFRRLGGGKERQVDVRIIAASNQNLQAALKEGRFREDLYWRINVVPLYLPPLRERPEDIDLFSVHFLAQFAQDQGIPQLELTKAAWKKLKAHTWPGNIRQLHNVLLRATLIATEYVLRPKHIVFDEFEG